MSIGERSTDEIAQKQPTTDKSVPTLKLMASHLYLSYPNLPKYPFRAALEVFDYFEHIPINALETTIFGTNYPGDAVN